LAPFVVALLTLPVVAYAVTVIDVYEGNSIQAAIDTAKAGEEEICVHPGTYNENIRLRSGVDVYSSNGPDTTIIVGDSTWTVFADTVSYTPSTEFSGFTIEGGEGYGMYAYSCGLFQVRDLVFNCDADTAALYDFHSGIYATFENITVNGPGGAMSGLEAYESSADYDTIRVRGIEKRGIYVRGSHAPSFSAVTVDSCGTGIYLHWAEEPTFNGGSVSDCTTGFEAFSRYPNTTKLEVRNVDVSDCATGFSCGSDSSAGVVNVAIDSCTVTDCTDGMILDRPSGHVKNTDFEDIDDIAITVTEGDRLTIGGDDSTVVNTFNDVDGVGVLADSGAVVTIKNNYFDYVLGTAVQVETDNDSTVVSDCDMDGTGGCYEGIATSVHGTMATIRECKLHDYSADQIPKPRGVTAIGATANLGQGSSDKGNNSFVTMAIDLSYTSKLATPPPPPTLYAEYNWWGEDPPDTNQITGLRAYVDYDPWLKKAPSRSLPVTEGPAEVPAVPGLSNVCPNPGAGSVELHFWMPEDGRVELSVYNLEGRLVRTLYNGEVTAGPGSVRWDGCDGVKRSCPSGVYLIRMMSNSGTDTGRFVLVR
jgi:hypothetical protein